MADMDVDQAPRPDEGAGDSLDSSQSEKVEVNGDGEVLNHIDQNKQNGYPETVAETPAKSSESSVKKEHRDKDKHHSSSSKHSSSSDKKHSSSSSHKHGSSSSSSKHHSSSSSSSKHRDGHSSSSKHGSSSSSSKHRDGHSSSSSSKDKHHSSSSSSRDKDKDKHRSSSSHPSDKDKHKHSSSSSSKHSSSSSDKHRDKDKHSSSSSSKHNSSSSSKHSSSKDNSNSKKENLDVDKEKERQERKEKERRERKERERQERKEKEKLEAEVKQEPASPVKRERSPVKSSPVKTSPSKPVKEEAQSESDDDDVPLSVRLQQEQNEEVNEPVKRELESDDEEDDAPLSARVAQVKKVKKEVKKEKTAKKRQAEESDYEDDYEPVKKKKKKTKPAVKQSPVKQETGTTPKKRGKKQEETQEVWKWWEEEKMEEGVKWQFLEHRGPLFAPDYEPLPKDVHFYYDKKPMKLSQDAEEVSTFYGKMLDNDYTTKEVFNNNFFKDWRKTMSKEEKAIITDLKKCNFREICDYFKGETEKRKNKSKEQKLKLKQDNEALMQEYGFCTMDSHKEKIGNFRIEPPGLFRGRGDHPKQGQLKTRTLPEDVIINCSKDSEVPAAPAGHKWKRVQFDNTVSWLASWNENVQNQTKYVMLNASSRLKGEKDWQKYETARRLHKCVDKIRANYQEDWKSREMKIRQRSVAMYFIDKLALRAGNEKDEGEADTVGCCSLRVEHIALHTEKDGKQNVVEFDFLGKDSIRYYNAVPVEKRVFKNLQMFVDNKAPRDDLFDRLNTVILNKHLHELMEGLTAKVFRTYNASKTLQEQLDVMTNEDDGIAAKMLSYNRANRAVAILCNHQRAAPKNFSKQMENIMTKIKDKRVAVKDSKKALKDAKQAFKENKTQNNKMMYEKKKKAFERMEEQLTKLEVAATDKDENKEIALGTSKLNYLDPRISVAWCKKWEVPIEKVYNKTQREKFRWAVDMATADFTF